MIVRSPTVRLRAGYRAAAGRLPKPISTSKPSAGPAIADSIPNSPKIADRKAIEQTLFSPQLLNGMIIFCLAYESTCYRTGNL